MEGKYLVTLMISFVNPQLDILQQCVVFEMAQQYAKITKWNDRYWTETLSNDKRIVPEDLITSTKFLRLEILKPSKRFCGKPDELYPTRYPELFVKIVDGGFNLEGGLKLALKSQMRPYDPN